MQLRTGVPVEAEDGRAGRVDRIILHPSTREIAGIVAVQAGLPPRDVIIPVELIVAADDNAVRVRATVAEIAALQPFAQSQYVAPPESWIPPGGLPSSVYLLPASPYTIGAFQLPARGPGPAAHEVETLGEGQVPIDEDTIVYTEDGAAGRLERIVTEGDTDVVAHLVVRTEGRERRRVRVPMDRIAAMGDEGIRLCLSEEDLERLPAYPG